MEIERQNIKLELNKVIDNLPYGIIFLTSEFKIIYSNLNIRKLLGISNKSIIGKDIFDIDFFKDILCLNKISMKRRIFVESDFVRNGKYKGRYYEIEMIPQFNSSKSLKSVIGVIKDITELHNEIDSLRYERDQAQKYLDGAAVIMVAIGADQKVKLINRKGCEILGYSKEEVIGKNWFDNFIPPEYRDKARSIFKKSIKGEIKHFDYYERDILTKSGEYRLIGWYNTVLSEKNGRIESILCSGEDITEKKRTQEAILQSEIKYRTIFENTGTAMAIVEVDTTISLVNSEFERLSGLSWHKIQGKMSWQDFIHPDEVQRMREYHILRRINPEHAPRKYESRFIDIFGNVKNVIIAADLIPGTQKSVLSFIDITERKIAEEEVKRRERQFRTLIENSPNIIFRVNKDLEVLYMSPGIKELLGIEPERFLGYGWRELNINDSIVSSLVAAAQKVFSSNKPERLELNLISLNIDRFFQCHLVPEFDKNDIVESVLIIGNDITKLKEAEEILKRDKDTFERLVREKSKELLDIQRELDKSKRLSDIGTFAATIAHELRNPLNVIKIAVHNIKNKIKRNFLSKHFDNIDASIQQSNNIISNILNYSKIKMPVKRELVVRSFIQECVEASKARYNKYNVSFKIILKCKKTTKILVDPYQIREVMDNIIDNAYESFKKRRGKITIFAGFSVVNEFLFSIKDNGCGISDSELERIFEPFYTTKPDGTGLGLSLCQQIIKLHDGRIEINSKKGKGTTVNIYLPQYR